MGIYVLTNSVVMNVVPVQLTILEGLTRNI